MTAGVRRFERAALIVNHGSRRGAAVFADARRLLAAHGVPLVHEQLVTEGGRIADVVDEVVTTTGCDLLVIGGGDGTMSAAVDRLVGQPVVLGVLPLGTANDFARTLQVPADAAAACATVATGKVVDVDIGRIESPTGGTHFLNVASLGLSVGVTQALSPRIKARLGVLAYPLAAVRAYQRHRPFTAELQFPDGDHQPLQLDDLLQVAIGNGVHYGGGYTVSPLAGIDDHTLDVYAIPQGRLRDHVSIARLFRDGSFVEHELVVHLRTRRVRVLTEPQQLVNVDGELCAGTPAELSVHRNALHVVVPQTATSARLDGTQPRAAMVQEVDA